jgi:hypothetical protein
VLDWDLRDFFGTLKHDWLIRFVEHRIADQRLVRLIRHEIRKFRRPWTNQNRIKRLCHLGEVHLVDEALVLLAYDAHAPGASRSECPVPFDRAKIGF